MLDPAHLARLVQVMEAEALYRDPDLSLGSLAQHVGLPPNTVSHLLNAGIGQTFTDWVNHYRVAEVERRLRTPAAQRYTVLALALEAGFNSKTTFNRVFKERNGLTPSQYLKRCHPTLRRPGPAGRLGLRPHSSCPCPAASAPVACVYYYR